MPDPTILHAEIAVPAALLRAAPTAGLTPNKAAALALAHQVCVWELEAALANAEVVEYLCRRLDALAQQARRREIREAGEGLTPDEVRAELGRRLEERAGE